jgi:hypothetical protein
MRDQALKQLKIYIRPPNIQQKSYQHKACVAQLVGTIFFGALFDLLNPPLTTIKALAATAISALIVWPTRYLLSERAKNNYLRSKERYDSMFENFGNTHVSELFDFTVDPELEGISKAIEEIKNYEPGQKIGVLESIRLENESYGGIREIQRKAKEGLTPPSKIVYDILRTTHEDSSLTGSRMIRRLNLLYQDMMEETAVAKSP